MSAPAWDIIARIETPFDQKFGVPRQSGIADCPGRIVFEKPFRDADAVRGLEGFSHIWLIWQFDRALRQGWSPTVRPPRLGGNARMGVFATRSPFRPNGLGLSAVELERVEPDGPEGPVLYVRGADMVSGTPIFDIKPYLAYADSYPDAAGGFTGGDAGEMLTVDFPPELLAQFDSGQRHGLISALSADPRPRYQDDPDRVYGMAYGGKNVTITNAYTKEQEEPVVIPDDPMPPEDDKPDKPSKAKDDTSKVPKTGDDTPLSLALYGLIAAGALLGIRKAAKRKIK